MDSELLTCLLKFIEYFPDYLSVLSRMLLRFFWTTFVETAVFNRGRVSLSEYEAFTKPNPTERGEAECTLDGLIREMHDRETV